MIAGSLSSDALRLSQLDVETIDKQVLAREGGDVRRSVEGFALTRAGLIAWKGKDIVEQLSNEDKVIKDRFIHLLKYMLPNGVQANSENYSKTLLGQIATRPVARNLGSLRPGSTVTYERFWVACFLYKSAWDNIVLKPKPKKKMRLRIE